MPSRTRLLLLFAMKKTLALLLLLAGLSGEVRAETLTWNGTEGHMTWNTEDMNWQKGSIAAKYTDRDTVEFCDTGSGIVTLAGELAPASVLVNSGETYTFAGNGSLTGTMQLTKEGEGKLTIQTANDYMGGTLIKGGTLVMGNANALGSGIVSMSGATLDLGGHTLSNTVSVQSHLKNFIGSGSFNGELTVEGMRTQLSLFSDLSGTGTIFLSGGSELNLSGHTLNTNVTVLDSCIIDSGMINGKITVNGRSSLHLAGNLAGSGTISLADGSGLVLDGLTLSNTVTVQGSVAVHSSNGSRIDGDISLEEGAVLTLYSGDLSGTGTVTLGDSSTLNLNNHTLSNRVILGGSATIGNGSINGDISVKEGAVLTLHSGDLSGTGTVTLGDSSTLNLNNHTLSNRVILGGSATIGNGTVNGSINVAEDEKLTLQGSTTVTGAINMASHSSLDLGGNTFHIGGEDGNKLVLDGSISGIGNGTINGSINVADLDRLTLLGNLDGTGTIFLAGRTNLNLGGHVLSKSVTIEGAGFINSGNTLNATHHGDLTVAAGARLGLHGNLEGTGTIFLADGASLVIYYGYTLAKAISVEGNATIEGNEINGSLAVATGKTLTLNDDLSGSGTITLNDSATLNIGTHTLSKNVTLNGTSTVKAENTTIKALNTDKEGLMQALSVSDGLIAGTDRQSSLADGLDISRMGQDLKLENLVLTANNKISVGDGHAITLKDVTIKISDDVCQLVNGIYTIDLKSLINCDLVMENVLLDASDLTLPEGFDPATTSVVFDFGNDVSIKQATGLDMRVGNYWSPSMNLDQQGKVIFTKLVDTPEPTTGTLSLLALAALAARRRRK